MTLPTLFAYFLFQGSSCVYWDNLKLGDIELLSTFIQLKETLHTLFLFTYTDYKTILFPISVFASVAAPVTSWRHFTLGLIWIWLHLIQCNVSNQYKTIEEDKINHPWRPLPSGRISLENATRLRLVMVPVCLAVSAWFGGCAVVLASVGLSLTTVVYDECGWAGHWIGKNAAAVCGYGTFEVGATLVMGNSKELSSSALQSILISISVIFTTIHAQDCPDVEGDAVLGRVTFPIYAPIASRLVLLLLLPFWSLFNVFHWNIFGLLGLAYIAFGAYAGLRYWAWKEQKDDVRSYLVYNVWLLATHFLPITRIL